MDEHMVFTVTIHNEDGSLWAEVAELPGCFASGDTMTELEAALNEAISFYIDRDVALVSRPPDPGTSERHELVLA